MIGDLGPGWATVLAAGLAGVPLSLAAWWSRGARDRATDARDAVRDGEARMDRIEQWTIRHDAKHDFLEATNEK